MENALEARENGVVATVYRAARGKSVDQKLIIASSAEQEAIVKFMNWEIEQEDKHPPHRILKKGATMTSECHQEG